MSIPLQLNQTRPTSIELIRYDLHTSHNETTKLSKSAIGKMINKAIRHPSGAQLLQHSVSRPGLYRLGRVIDETNLEVGHPTSEALVVPCPSAKVKPAGPARCRGDLSNIVIEVEGSPPLKIKYRKTVNGEDPDITYQSIQPEDFSFPAIRHPSSGPLISASQPDLSWAAPAHVDVPLNETLSRGGRWSYAIDQVIDAFGNTVSYREPGAEYEPVRHKGPNLEDSFEVHERPVASLDGHYVKDPVRAAQGEAVSFPIKFQSNLKPDSDTQYFVDYRFTPSHAIGNNGEHSAVAETRSIKAQVGQPESIVEPGLYTLESVRSNYCPGNVEEPSSFVLVNPPAPSVDLRAEKLVDKCANRQIGLRAEFDMTGTPPFTILYSSRMKGGQAHHEIATFDGPRGHLEFTPELAGHRTYKLLALDDALYKNVDLRRQGLVLEQDVRPSVYAIFTHYTPTKTACIDEPVNFEVKFQGDGPWMLEYELVHGKQRTKHQVNDITSERYTITTDRLSKGGEYSLALVGVTDGQGCREALQQDAKVSFRLQRPRVAFGNIDGRRSVRTLEQKVVDLPLRLAGEGPWTVDYRHAVNDSVGNVLLGPIHSETLRSANDGLGVTAPGVYELVGVNDALCPGTVDDAARTFDVQWVDRPRIVIPQTQYTIQNGDEFVRSDVCEGDDDAVDVAFFGRPPYEVKYQEHIRPAKGSKSVRPVVQMNIPGNSAQIKLDTSQAGTYDYAFTELSDYNYDHDVRRHRQVTIQQRVHGKPAASFVNPGKVHSFCQDNDAESGQAYESVPIKLEGQAPFTIDLEIRHQGSSKALKPRTITVPNIPANSHLVHLAHSSLQVGTSNIVVRRVLDSRGCERSYDAPSSIPSNQKASQVSGNAAPRIQVSVSEAPTLVPAETHRLNYCVGDRLGFSLGGTPPLNVFYTFRGSNQKASVAGSTFKRIAEKPGNFTITGVSDAASGCRSDVKGVSRVIHDLPHVRVSKGKSARYEIHAGGHVDVTFEFEGTPPFHFTYTRTEMVKQKGAIGGYRQGRVLDTRTLKSDEKIKRITETEEGIYEVVAIRDMFCSFARNGYEGTVSGSAPEGAGRVLDSPDQEQEYLLEL